MENKGKANFNIYIYINKNMKTIDSTKKGGSNETWSGKAIGVVAFAAIAYFSY